MNDTPSQMQEALREAGIGGDDKLVPFHVSPLDVRGRAVQLGPMLTAILARHDYPDEVSKLLGEVIVLCVLLGTSLKFDGRFTVQTQTNGPVNLLVVDYKSPDSVRAYAGYDPERLADAIASGTTAPELLLGDGILAMTIDQGSHTQRYQGIVELNGAALEEVAQAYFRQSEQIPTHLRMAVSQELTPNAGGTGSNRTWRAGGVLVQFLPEKISSLTVRDIPGGDAPQGAEDPIGAPIYEERNDLWVEAQALVATISDDELTDPGISAQTLLFRLFHEHGVYLYDGPQVHDRCSCTREKIVDVLKTLSAEELEESWENGRISSNCEFCATSYTILRSEFEGE
jgi:molecular chaperone Hsp33